MSITISPVGDHPTICFAAEELARYLRVIGGVECRVAGEAAADIRLGLGEAFAEATLPAVAEARLDDAVAIRMDGGRGIIAGSNPRSVLLGVYRYLHALGCRWVRPGADGEYLPAVELAATSVHLCETPSYRHRALDLAGALSYEFMLEVVDWAPKVGLSGVFLEFDTCFNVLNLWYSHARNPLKSADPFTREQAEACRQGLLAAVAQRDLLYHAKGHGWAWEALAVTAEQFTNPLPAEVAQYVAETEGARQVTRAGAGSTNLCYGNPAARRRYAETVVRYAQAHPEADYLHVWLADGINNHCECPACRETRPADVYLLLMHELDAALTAAGLPTRIVFLIYVDLLWPPEAQRIAHPERFTLMFAPFYRSYTSSFAEVAFGGDLPELPPYRRNQLLFDRGVQQNVDFLAHWKQIFTGDAFDFDYQYWLSQYDDPGGMHRARVLHGDIQHLQRIGLNGLVGCYTLRCFYPTGIGMAAMGQTLWAKDTPFAAIVADYFPASFGPEWQLCADYLQRLSDLFDPVYLRGEKPLVDAAAAASLAQIPQIIAEFAPVIARNLALDNPCWAASWRYLRDHAPIAVAFAHAYQARARGDFAESRRLFADAKALVFQYEDALFPVLDSWLCAIYLDERAEMTEPVGR